MVVQEDKPTYTPRVKTYTLQEYLVKEDRSVHKHEFYNGQIIAPKSKTTKQNIAATNITVLIHNKIEKQDLSFKVIGSKQKIYIAAENKVLYPDAVVVFEVPEHWENSDSLLINPLLIVEVASKSTRKYDRGDKFLSYRTLPSFKEYILVEQDTPKVESFFRESENTWNIHTETNIENAIQLRSLGFSIDLKKIYKGVL